MAHGVGGDGGGVAGAGVLECAARVRVRGAEEISGCGEPATAVGVGGYVACKEGYGGELWGAGLWAHGLFRSGFVVASWAM